MKVILPVPLIPQPENTLECGIACAAMVESYDGKLEPYENLKEKLALDIKTGMYMPSLGRYFLSQNYKVEFQTMNPHLFNKASQKLSQEELKHQIEDLKSYRYKDRPDYQLVIDKFVAFMNEGGVIIPKIPEAKDIRHEIDQKRPVIANVTHNFLSQWIGYNMHMVTISGYDKKGFFINDPLPHTSDGKIQKYSTQDMMYAIHATTGGDIDNGSLLKLRPR